MDTLEIPQEPYVLTQVEQYEMDIEFSIVGYKDFERELLPASTTVVEAVSILIDRRRAAEVIAETTGELADDVELEWRWISDWVEV